MTYFTTQQRRDALLAWLRRAYGQGGMFNRREAFDGARDVYTPLYGGGDERRCGGDLRSLAEGGHLERVGNQWSVIEPRDRQ